MIDGHTIGGRFTVERREASGGMGVVYRARDLASGAPVAVKVLSRDACDEGRFVREAEVLAELRHPGIVRYVAHGRTDDGAAFLAMEWLEGEDLGRRLARAALTVDESVQLVARVAEALASAHALGVVHRDIKPTNVFLVDRDLARPKLLDFGIARQELPDRIPTASGLLLGTPGYMAPEQARGERPVDARADVFALGCLLFECITGRPAFRGDNAMTVLAKIVLGEVPRLRDVRADTPPSLDAIVARMLAKDREQRFRDAGTVALALSKLEPDGSSSSPRLSTGRLRLGTAERRLVSVVLVRLPSDLRSDATMVSGTAETHAGDATVDTVRAIVDKHGGELELLPRSFVIALTGTGPATDLAGRAARCALDLRAALADARIALATGRTEVRARTTASEPIDRAADALKAKSAAREVRIDDATAGLLDGRFEIGGDEQGLFLRRERDAVETRRTLLGRETPCVGRDREIAALRAIWEECVESSVARIALVTGAAGLGKTRLRHELTRSIQRGEVWLARGDALRAGSPWALFGEAMRRAAGVRDDEPSVVRERKLRARVSRNLGGDRGERLGPFLGEIAGVPFDDEEIRAARRDPARLGERATEAFVQLLDAECAAHPILLVVDDLHWGDLPSVRLIDAAVRDLAERPLMVLALARPEVHEVFPRLWASRPLHEVRLAELPRRAAAELARDVLGDKADDAMVARLVSDAAGNAFVLEELIRAVAAGEPATMPGSVLAMIQARLETLDAPGRRMLRAASVVGATFWEGAVAALVEEGDDRRDEVRGWLRELERREFVAKRTTSRFAGEDEWSFRHVLVRDAAYAMLTEEDARNGHRVVAEWLENVGERDPMVLAEHWERGADQDRAVASFRAAARRAFFGNDLVAAIACAERGVAAGARGEDRAALHLVEAEAHSWRDDVVRAERAAHEAMRCAPRGSPLWWRAAADVINFAGLAGGRARVLEVATAMRDAPWDHRTSAARAFAAAFATVILFNVGEAALARTMIDRLRALTSLPPALEGWVQLAEYMRARFGGRAPSAALASARRALAAFERANDPRGRAWAAIALGWALDAVGRTAEAEPILREVHQEATRIGLPWAMSWAAIYWGRSLARVDPARGKELIASAIARLDGGGNVLFAALGRMELARVHLRERDVDAAASLASKAVEDLEGFGGYRAHARAVFVQCLLAGGARARATEVHAAEPLAGDALDEGSIAFRLSGVALRIESGDRGGAERALDELLADLRERAADLGADGDVFLGGIDGLAEIEAKMRGIAR